MPGVFAGARSDLYRLGMTMKIVSLRVAAVAVLAAATVTLAACGGSDDQAATSPAAAATTPVDLPSIDLPSEVGGGDNGGDCDGGAADAVKKAVTSPAVTKIQVIGGCTEVSIETSLAPTAKADGVKICEAAAKVAYTGNVMAVSVDGSDGHELSAGIKGAPCV
jgi:hypothetical protein